MRRLVLPGAVASVLGASTPDRLVAQTTEPVTAAMAFGDVMRHWTAANTVPRASIAVMRDGKLVFAEGYGGRSPMERVPVWSLSKAITAVCAALLVEEGKLGFDEPAGRSLAAAVAKHGEFADRRLGEVSVGQLILHRSGIPRVAEGNRYAPGMTAVLRAKPPAAATVDDLLPDLHKVALVRPPGSGFEYTNIGYLLLGQVIEAAAGESYEAACGRRVLTRAGVRSPRLDPQWGGLGHAAAGWALSGAEYLAFARALRPGPAGILSAHSLA